MLPSNFSNSLGRVAHQDQPNTGDFDNMAYQRQRRQQETIQPDESSAVLFFRPVSADRSQSWSPKKPRQALAAHQRAQSVPRADARPAAHRYQPGPSSSIPLSPSTSPGLRANFMLPQSKFSTQVFDSPRQKPYDRLVTSSPGLPRALTPSPVIHRSFTETAVMTGRERAINQLIKDTDEVYGQLAASLLPEGFHTLERSQTTQDFSTSPFSKSPSPHRATTFRDQGALPRTQTLRNSHQPSRRFDFGLKQISRSTSVQVLAPSAEQLRQQEQQEQQEHQQQQQQSEPVQSLPASSPKSVSPFAKRERKQAAKGQRKGRSVAESVADAFSSLRGITANEILTPEKVQQLTKLRELREAQQQLARQKSWDLSVSQDLHSLEPKKPVKEAAVAVPLLPPPPMRLPMPEEEHRARMADDVFSPGYTSLSFNPQNRLLSDAPPLHPNLGPLPEAPRLRITAPDGEPRHNCIPRKPVSPSTPTPASKSFDFFKPIETDSFVYFKSNPCTVTMSAFRHGPIRLEKEEKDPKLGADENLDWTAFQMAILGGAGEYDDFSDEDETEQASELRDWFLSFGFSNAGRLVDKPEDNENKGKAEGEDKTRHRDEDSNECMPATATVIATTTIQLPPPPHSPSSVASLSPVSSNASTASPDSDPELSAPRARDFSSPFWRSRTGFEILSSPAPLQPQFQPPPPPSSSSSAAAAAAVTQLGSPADEIARWVAVSPYINSHSQGMGGRKPPLHRDSVDSLPQSPMMPLGAAVAGEVDVVPMGYNLGHDLGDFLKWESEQMYAAAFYRP